MRLGQQHIRSAAIIIRPSTTEEMVKTDFQHSRAGCIGCDVPTHTNPFILRLQNHRDGIPTQYFFNALFNFYVPRVDRLIFRRNGIDIGCI